MSEKKQRQKRGFWRICRVYFRRFRILSWLLILTLLGCLLYLNQVGLPEFVKAPLLDELRHRGIELQFSRLRLRWYQGIVAEEVRFGQAEEPYSPQFTLQEVQLGLNAKALLRRRLQVDELVLRHGQLVWPIPGDPQDRKLMVENIQTHLRFLPDDQWALDNFTADFVNAKIQLSGVVTNASAVSQWPVFHGEQKEPGSAALWQRRLRRLAETLDSIRFSATPELRVNVQGDAKALPSFTVRMALGAPGAETPWGAVSGGHFTARVFAADTNGTSRAELNIEAAQAQTPWAAITNLHLQMRLVSSEAKTNLIQGELSLSAAQARTAWAGGSNVTVWANWVHSITNPIPISGEGRLRSDAAETRWGTGKNFQLSGTLSLPDPASLPESDASWAWWTNIYPYALDWRCALDQFESRELTASNISCAGTWRAPDLEINNLSTRLYEGKLDAGAILNVATRRLNSRVRSDFDPHRVAPVLPESARRWLGQFTWPSPPFAEGRVALTLPAWTNGDPDWAKKLPSTLELDGQFKAAGGGTYRQVEITAANSHFTYSNQCWHLPDLLLRRPEGLVIAEHRANERTGDFYWHIISNVDPSAVRPLLSEKAQESLSVLALTEPPLVDLEVWGRSRAPELTGAKATLSLTNFSFRGESATGLQTAIAYTNKVLHFLHPRLQRGEQRASADAVTADFNTQFVCLSNGFSTFEPMVIARAIGAKIGAAIEPYVFSNPPVARVEGVIPMHGEEGADLHFQLEGGPFHWWRFNVPWITGQVHWSGLNLTLRDVRASFYQGAAAGLADFKFSQGKKGADFTCSVVVSNSLLQQLMTDVSTGTNRLEGTLDGTMHFTKADTENWNALYGYGEIKLRDGLIWEIPLFGLFTPILNGISPGLGNSRASAGTCNYYITNGLIRTDDLEIRASALRLQYRGSVDLESRVNARVEAELLRDMWLVGPLVSTVLWPVTKMFEYRVGGTLSEPKMEPVYIVPKLMFMPFHPVRTLKSLLPEEPGSRTNAPPVFNNH